MSGEVKLTLRDKVLEALGVYGEKAYAVLRAALEVCEELESSPTRRNVLGDFEYRLLVRKLAEIGYEYNPSLLLRRLEREYGIIETSYWSSNQHWWRFTSREAVEEALAYYTGGSEDMLDDAELQVLRVQYAALEPEQLLARLRRLARKRRLSRGEREWFRRFAFDTLSMVVDLLERCRERDELSREAEVLEEIVRLSVQVSSTLRRASLGASTSSLEATPRLGLKPLLGAEASTRRPKLGSP